jgi:hypothetical protein
MRLTPAAILIATLLGCGAPSKPYPFTELVLMPGTSITAELPIGSITINADDPLKRTYTWEGASRSVRLWPRPERWYGNLGAYYPGPGEHWREHHGITRGVLQEGQQHFQTIEEALTWIRQPWQSKCSVYRDDGLFVLFDKTPERKQINVDLIQILVGGHKPTSLPGSQNEKIRISGAKPNAT